MSKYSKSKTSSNFRDYVDIPEETQIKIVNNSAFRFVLKHSALMAGKLVLNKREDDIWMTFKELKAYKGAYPQYFENLTLLIGDVRGHREVQETDEFGNVSKNKKQIILEDVLYVLDLLSKYKSYAKSVIKEDSESVVAPGAGDLEEYLLNSKLIEFEATIDNSSIETVKVFVDMAMELYRDGHFTDSNKMDALEKRYGRKHLFENIKDEKEFEEKVKNKPENN